MEKRRQKEFLTTSEKNFSKKLVTSKIKKKKKKQEEETKSSVWDFATSLFLTLFEVIFDLLLNRRTAISNLFVK